MVLAGICIFVACKKMDSTYKQFVVTNGITYPGKATAPVVHSGYNRVRITWLRGSDPKVTRAKIYWNNFTDSVGFDVPANQDTIGYTIPAIPENFYSFIIKTYDSKGNVSVPVELSGSVYGERYRSNLLQRPLISSTINLANKLTLQFDPLPAATTIVGTEIEYTNTSGQVKVVRLKGDVVSYQFPDYQKETSYRIRTLHMPDAVALDVFYTDYQVVDAFVLNKTEWRVIDFSSQNPDANNLSIPANMIDGNPATRWVSLATTSRYPHYITVDFGAVRTLKTVSLWRWVQAVADERGPNVVQFLGSVNNTTWSDLGTYNFNRLTNSEQKYNIPNLPQVRYLKVVAVSGPQTFVVLGEVNVSVK